MAAEVAVVRNGLRGQPVIALTFDDCYLYRRGQKIRQILREYQVPATLFCAAEAMSYQGDLMRGFLADGNEFGNHTITHPNLTKLRPQEIRHQICGARRQIDQVLRAPSTRLFRPPYAEWNRTVSAIAGECGYTHLALWDIDTRDWSGISADAIVSRALQARNGSIVLLHIGPANTVVALPRIIKQLRAKGFRLVKLSTLIEGS